MTKKIISLLAAIIILLTLAIHAFASDIVFIDDNFEDLSTENWSDNTGRGVKAIVSSDGNNYMEFTSNSTSYYNFQAKDVYSTSLLYCEFDIKFTSNNMEIQLRESIDVSSSGFTMAGRLRKNAYYLEYFSNGTYIKMPPVTDKNAWYILDDVDKWYTIKLALDIPSDTYSVYLIDKESQNIESKVENVPFSGECQYVNYVAFSSTDKLCIDNIDIREIDIQGLKITGAPYVTIPSIGSRSYTYYANAYSSSNVSSLTTDVKWGIVTPKDGVTINEDTGVLTITATAKPGPIIIKTEKEYQPTLVSTYLVDLER